MNNIDAWARFLAAEKLTPKSTNDPETLIKLCELLSAHGLRPCRRPYEERQLSRAILCLTAMQNGIDLAKWRYDIGRGLLDMWNVVYYHRYGSTFGTAGAKEIVRRKVKTKLGGKPSVQFSQRQ